MASIRVSSVFNLWLKLRRWPKPGLFRQCGIHPSAVLEQPAENAFRNQRGDISMAWFGGKDWNIIAVIFERPDLYRVNGQRGRGGDATTVRDAVKKHPRTIFWGVFDQKGAYLEGGLRRRFAVGVDLRPAKTREGSRRQPQRPRSARRTRSRQGRQRFQATGVEWVFHKGESGNSRLWSVWFRLSVWILVGRIGGRSFRMSNT